MLELLDLRAGAAGSCFLSENACEGKKGETRMRASEGFGFFFRAAPGNAARNNGCRLDGRFGVTGWKLKIERGRGSMRMRDEDGEEGMGKREWRWELGGKWGGGGRGEGEGWEIWGGGGQTRTGMR